MTQLFKKTFPGGTLFVTAFLIAGMAIASAKDSPQGSPMSSTAAPDTLSGNYLAGRFAQIHQDWTAAEDFLNRAYQLDPGNTALLQRSFLLALGSGDFRKSRCKAQAGPGSHADLVAAGAMFSRQFGASRRILSLGRQWQEQNRGKRRCRETSGHFALRSGFPHYSCWF